MAPWSDQKIHYPLARMPLNPIQMVRVALEDKLQRLVSRLEVSLKIDLRLAYTSRLGKDAI